MVDRWEIAAVEEEAPHLLFQLFQDFSRAKFSETSRLLPRLNAIPVFRASILERVRRKFDQDNIKSCIRSLSFQYRFDKEVLLDLKEFANDGMFVSTELTYVLAFQAVAILYVDDGVFDESVYAIFVELFTAVLGIAPVLISFLFGELTDRAMVSPFEWKGLTVNAAFVHFTVNRNLDERELGHFIRLCEIMAKDESMIPKMFQTIRKFVRDKNAIVAQGLFSIVSLIDPFIRAFSKDALLCLAEIAHVRGPNDAPLLEAFGVLPVYVYEDCADVLAIDEKKIMRETVEDVSKLASEQGELRVFPRGLSRHPSYLYETVATPFSQLPEEQKAAVAVLVEALSKVESCYVECVLSRLRTIVQEHASLDLMAVFLQICRVFPSDEMINLAIERLSLLGVFQCVEFGENGTANAFKNEIVSILLEKHVGLICNVLKQVEHNPVPFAEMLGRLDVRMNRKALVIVFEKQFSSIRLCALCLQKMLKNDRSDCMIRAYNATLLIILRLSLEFPKMCFGSKLFVIAYIHLMRDSDISGQVVMGFSEALSLFACTDISKSTAKVMKDFLAELLDHSIANWGDSDCFKFVKRLSDAIVRIVRREGSWSGLFFELLNRFLEFLCKRNHLPTLKNVLVMLLEARRELTSDRLLILAGLIRHHEYRETHTILLGLMAGMPSCGVHGMYLIERPYMIRLIWAVYETTVHFHDILTHFTDLAKFSAHNIKAMHKGGLDTFLVGMVNSEKGISRKADANGKRTEIELLTTICGLISSRAFCLNFCSMIDTVEWARLMRSILDNSSLEPRKLLDVGTCGPLPLLYGIDSVCFRKGFSLSFKIKVDTAAIEFSNIVIGIVTITDGSSVFQLHMNQQRLYALYEDRRMRTQVELCRCSLLENWPDVVVEVTYELDDTVAVKTYVDGVVSGNSGFCPILFADGIVSVVFGKVSRAPSHSCSAWLSKNFYFSIHGTDDRFDLFDGDPVIKQGTLANISSLMDVLLDMEDPLNIIVRKFYDGESADFALFFEIMRIIGHIFAMSPRAQAGFVETDLILSFVKRASRDYATFCVLCDVYRLITEAELRKKWFMTFVMNIGLWSTASRDSRVLIFGDIAMLHIDRNIDLIKGSDMFVNIVDLFDKHVESDFEVDDGLKESFICIVENVAVVSMEEHNLACVLSKAVEAQTDAVRMIYMNMFIYLVDIVKEVECVVSEPLKLSCIDQLQAMGRCNNCPREIIVCCIIGTCSLCDSTEICDTVLQMVKGMKSRRDLLSLFMDYTRSSPEIVPIVCYMGLDSTAEDKEQITLTICAALADPVRVSDISLWMTWLVIFCLGVDEKSQSMICWSLAILGSKDVSVIETAIDFFIICHELRLADLILSFAIALPYSDDMLDFCLNKCFELIFFHFGARESRHSAFLDLVEKETGSPRSDRAPLLPKVRITSFADFSEFVDRGFSTDTFRCGIDLTSNLEFVDSNLIDLVLSTNSKRCEDKQQILRYYANRRTGHSSTVDGSFFVFEQLSQRTRDAFDGRIARFYERAKLRVL